MPFTLILRSSRIDGHPTVIYGYATEEEAKVAGEHVLASEGGPYVPPMFRHYAGYDIIPGPGITSGRPTS